MNSNTKSKGDKQEKAQFSSRLGMILATIGFAAGVGNLWRFPYIVGINGGGIFLFFYLGVVLLVGMPCLLQSSVSVPQEVQIR
jgi:NSS family neurotransmitter:Na+ symporter